MTNLVPPDKPLSSAETQNCNRVHEHAITSDLDARGLACPLPLLKAKLELNRLDIGQCVRVLATDAGSVRDFHAYATISGHRLLHFKQRGNEYEYVLQKTEGRQT